MNSRAARVSGGLGQQKLTFEGPDAGDRDRDITKMTLMGYVHFRLKVFVVGIPFSNIVLECLTRGFKTGHRVTQVNYLGRGLGRATRVSLDRGLKLRIFIMLKGGQPGLFQGPGHPRVHQYDDWRRKAEAWCRSSTQYVV